MQNWFKNGGDLSDDEDAYNTLLKEQVIKDWALAKFGWVQISPTLDSNTPLISRVRHLEHDPSGPIVGDPMDLD